MLRRDENRRDTPFVQICEQFVHAYQRRVARGDGMKIPVHAIDHHDAASVVLDAFAYAVREFPW